MKSIACYRDERTWLFLEKKTLVGMRLFSQVEEPDTIFNMMFLMKKNRVPVFLSLISVFHCLQTKQIIILKGVPELPLQLLAFWYKNKLEYTCNLNREK